MSRQDAILQIARTRGRVFVDQLAGELGVSTHTIRRDINSLCENAKLRRLHGGAEFIESLANLPYPTRQVLNRAAKQQIASATAQIVPDGATVFFSIGSTPAIVAASLAQREGLTVVTNNLNVALAFADSARNRVILPGGTLRLPDLDVVDAGAEEVFATYRADFGIFGVGGIDLDGSLLDFHREEVSARETIRANARVAILVADSSKFGRRAAAVGGRLGDADLVVTEAYPGEAFAPILEPLGDRLILAGKDAQ